MMVCCVVCYLFVVCFFVVVTLPLHDFSERLKILNLCFYGHFSFFCSLNLILTLNSSPLRVKAVLHRGLLLAQR